MPTDSPVPSPGREIFQNYARSGFESAIQGWRWVYHRGAFTTLAVLLAALTLFWLPQTQHLLWQLPVLSGLSGTELLLSGLFALFITAFAAGFLTLVWLVVPRPSTGGWSPGRPEADGRWSSVPLHVEPPTPAPQRLDGLVEPLVRRAQRLSPRRRRDLGWGSFTLGAVLFALTWFWGAFLPSWWRTSGLTWTALLTLTGLWLGLAAGVSDATPFGYKRNLFGRYLWTLFLTFLVAQLTWTATNAMPAIMSSRVYTIYAVLAIIYLLVATARLIDACHVYSSWNIRAWTLFGLGFGLAAMPSQHVGSFWRLPPRPTTQNSKEEPTAPPAMPAWPAPAAPPTPVSRPGLYESPADSDSSPPAGVRTTATAAAPSMRLVSWNPSDGPALPTAQGPPLRTGPTPMKGSPTLPMSATIQEVWFRALWWKLSVLPPDQPVVFVSASGGGARAALFSSLVLEALRHTPLWPEGQPIPAPSPGFSPVNGEYHSLADQIVLMSSVSGGSLATAYYVHQSYPHVRALRGRQLSPDAPIAQGISPQPLTRTVWRNAFPSDIYNRMYTRSLSMLDAARIGRGQLVTRWAGPGFEETLEQVAAECGVLANPTTGELATPLSIAPWVDRSAFVDDMATDFMAPLLRGLLTPGLERGESVSRFWEDQFGWRDVSDLDLHRRLDPDRQIRTFRTNQAPLVLFNTCDVVQGSRLVLGFPPVPAGIIRDPIRAASSHGPYSLTDRGDLYYHLSLAEAVRLSANFPFGFEVAQLRLKAGTEPVLALDGGIVDNSGIDSITYLLEGLDRLAWSYERVRDRIDPANPNPSAEDLRIRHCDSLEAWAYRIMHELARRGVLLVQIDSGTKEIRTGGSAVSRLLAGLGGALVRPLQALNNTSYTNAENAVQNFDLALQGLLRWRDPPTYPCATESAQPTGGEAVSPAPQAPGPAPQISGSVPQAPSKAAPIAPGGNIPFGPNPNVRAPLIWRVRLTCNQSANVMTAWTLGPEDKAQVMVQFLIEWQHQRPVLLQCLNYVRQTAAAKQPPINGVFTMPPNAAFYYYQVGQRLADRARSEFYQMVSSPDADTAPLVVAPALDEPTRADLKQYEHHFRSANPASPGIAPAAPAVAPPFQSVKPTASDPPQVSAPSRPPDDSVPTVSIPLRPPWNMGTPLDQVMGMWDMNKPPDQILSIPPRSPVPAWSPANHVPAAPAEKPEAPAPPPLAP